MSHFLFGLHGADRLAEGQLNNRLLLVRVERGHYEWTSHKPACFLRFAIMEPKHLQGLSFSSSLPCTPKALWKFHWFLRDFGYDSELLARNEIRDKSLVGLRGVVKTCHVVAKSLSRIILNEFAPADQWKTLSTPSTPNEFGSEASE